MTPQQPAAPAAPAAPSAPASGGAGDLATQIDNVNRAVEQAAGNADARAAGTRQAATAGQGVGVVKDPGGRIVVTGPNGKTITIDPKAGLDGDQIQEMVQTALQPTNPERPRDTGPSGVWIPILSIVFGFVTLMALIVSRTMRARHAAAGSAAAVLPPETVARLARIEQAVDAVAIEVERISEAQRYSAQLLTERLGPAPALGAPLGARTADAPAARG